MALTLIHNGTVITMGPQGVIDPGAVVIKGTRLVEVGPSSILFNKYQKEASRRIDATGKLVMPGLIDAHFHSCQQFMRGLFNEVARRGQYFYPGWKRILIPFESALSAEDVYLSGLAAYTNMVRVGTTFVSEHGGRHPRQLAKAMEQVGVRGLMTLSTMDMDTDQPPLPANMLFTTEEAIAKNLAMVEQ
jgi:5-methylthioadenosine/S-adenosylhomocysteine deaminase